MLHSIQHLFLALVFLSSFALGAQDDEGMIILRNASFEDLPRHSIAPSGWTNCGAPGESPPDIHPDPEFYFKVSTKAQHENTFLGMVTRDTETYESVGQQLTSPLAAGQCYQFDIQLARSKVYLSMSRVTGQPTNYVKPIKLRVWGGYSICDKAQLLGESDLVSNFEWAQYRLRLKPEDDFTHIILEAYYRPAMLFPYNGNLLLDNARPFRPIDCDQPLLELAYDETTPEPVNPEDKIVPTPVPPRPRVAPNDHAPRNVIAAQPEPEEPTVRLGNTEAVLREGSIFAIEKISFKANSFELEENSEEALQEIVGFLRQNNNVIVEIGGHANRKAGNYTATNLSENRAKTVVSYLKKHSIGFERLLSKGYGKTKPVCMEDTQDCNRRNQRVEVKILKVKATK